MKLHTVGHFRQENKKAVIIHWHVELTMDFLPFILVVFLMDCAIVINTFIASGILTQWVISGKKDGMMTSGSGILLFITTRHEILIFFYFYYCSNGLCSCN